MGAVVGGAAGAAVGTAISPEQSTRVSQYVVTQPRPSVRVAEEVAVGNPLPPRVRLYLVPATVGFEANYSYTVVNGQTVLVDSTSREVIEIIE